MRVEYKKNIVDKILDEISKAKYQDKEIECIYLTLSEIREIARLYKDDKALDIIHTDKEYVLRDMLVPVRHEY